MNYTKRAVGIWQFGGFAFTALCGTLLHFLYDLLGKSPLVAPFSGVNESTFEHMKLLFWPTLLFAVVQYLFLNRREDFWCVKLRGILLGQGLIPVLFYTYNGAVKPSPDWLNISIFFISAAIVSLYEARLFYKGTLKCRSSKTALLLILLLGAAFVLFTFKPPHLGLFQDPITGGYGI